MRWTFALAMALLLTGYQSGQACGRYSGRLHSLARQVVSADEAAGAAAVEALRQAGPAGLEALFDVHGTAIQQALTSETTPPRAEISNWNPIRQALDAVGGQRNCAASHLYWYTDLAAAKAAARKAGKPILSLRLLGNLTDEYSCANSRFFRSTLYANAEVSRALRDRFVLHWQSVRPVPIITIDFGDGRKLQRTVTGNSVHYVLDAEGRPIDALPGLYGPQAFRHGIERAAQIARSLAAPDVDRAALLTEYHQNRLADLRLQWAADLDKLEMSLDAVPGAETHHATSIKLDELLDESLDDRLWDQIAGLHADNGTLDTASRNRIARQNPTAAAAARMAISKRVVESPLVRLLRNLQQTIALDTVRNEYLLHRRIHAWYTLGQVAELDALNERIYAELFLTPNSDPWLGLAPAETFTALENGGLVR